MKKYIKSLSIIFAISSFLLVSCETDTEYVESRKPQSIKIVDLTDNTIPIYTDGTYQVNMAVVPDDAEVVAPVTFTYKSSDTEIFTVSPDGLITAVNVGDAMLKVTAVEYPELTTMAIVKITDEYFPITSIEVDAAFKNYAMAVGAQLDLNPYITVKPDKASNPKLTYTSSNNEVATVNENGLIEAKTLGTATIKIAPAEGGELFAECIINVKEVVYNHIDRTNWGITASQNPLPKDDAISNSPESLLDAKTTTCLSMVKPGKTTGGVTGGADEELFFVIDMKAESTFEYLQLDHRSSNAYAYLRPYALSIFGSNDNSTFTPIMEDVQGQPEAANYKIHLPTAVKYRYVKVLYTDWDKKSGSSIQLSEINLGTKSFE